MKKTFFALIAIMAITTTAMASMKVDSVRYLNSTLKQNWFISAGATCNWWQGSMRTPEGYVNNYTAVEWNKPTIGFSVNAGKWITHNVAFRLRYSNNQIHSYIHGRHINLSHLQFLYGDNPTPVEGTGNGEIYATSMRYHNLMGDVMISPIDLIQGYYNPERVWTPVLYVSAGAACTSKGISVIKSIIDSKSGGDDAAGYNFELAGGLGLCNNFRLSNSLDINLDLLWTFQRWTIDSWTYEFDQDNIRPKRFDNLYTAALGITYYINREYELPVNCTDEIENLRKRLALCEEELKVIPIPTGTQPCDTVKVTEYVYIQDKDLVSYPFSIFFNKDSYQLMSRRDLVNLREIADVAKANGYKIRLRGSCDSATASAEYNQKLSENRCRKIMMELMEMGIPEDQIIMLPVGGVKELDPTEFDRRVLVELVKEAK